MSDSKMKVLVDPEIEQHIPAWSNDALLAWDICGPKKKQELHLVSKKECFIAGYLAAKVHALVQTPIQN